MKTPNNGLDKLMRDIERAVYEFQLDKDVAIDTINCGEYFPNCNGWGLRLTALLKKDNKIIQIGIQTVIQKNFR